MTPVSIISPSYTEPGAAVFSPCRSYRYALERRWGDGQFALFVGLNPSTATAEEDDPTVRRCIGFAKGWGFGGLLVGNAFAYRTPYPRELARQVNPIGYDTDVWLTTMAARAAVVVAAWGANALVTAERAQHVLEALHGGIEKVFCLGRTKSGMPKHPLYLPRSAKLELYA